MNNFEPQLPTISATERAVSPVLLVEDDPGLRQALCDTLEDGGFVVRSADGGEAALTLLGEHDFGLVLSDVRMPGMNGETLLGKISAKRPDLPVVLMTAHGSINGAVTAMRAGAVDYLEKPFAGHELLNRVRRLVAPTPDIPATVIAADPATRAVLALAKRLAPTDVTALVYGESGTGKEVIAHYIHENSTRSKGPFVAINCAAIPENLLEATLFGHERGAFTGAHQARAGKFEQAHGGTLLLDEVTEMDIGLQAKLLRVIQERELERVGGSRTIPFDVRIIATTNRNLQAAVEAGQFREDLYYRLNVLPVRLPPLRARRADIIPLAKALLARTAKAMNRCLPTLDPAAQHHLCSHSWPGNVRELDNLMQRALVLQPGNVIRSADLSFEESLPDDFLIESNNTTEDESQQDLRSHEQRMILETLVSCDGNRQKVAQQLGISPRTLRYKIARMRDKGIDVPGSRRA
jgi:two-component system, response regulator FlrC